MLPYTKLKIGINEITHFPTEHRDTGTQTIMYPSLAMAVYTSLVMFITPLFKSQVPPEYSVP